MKMMQFPKDEQVRAIIADLGSPTGTLQLAMSSAGKLLVGSLEDLIQPEDYEHANKVLQERGLDGLVLSIAPLLMQIREMDAKEVIVVRGVLQICIHVMQKAHAVCIAKLNALDPDSKSDIQINPEILSLMYGLANPYSEGLNQECCIFEMVQMYTTDEYIASKSKTTRKAFEQDVPGMATLLQFSEALNYLQFLTNNYTVPTGSTGAPAAGRAVDALSPEAISAEDYETLSPEDRRRWWDTNVNKGRAPHLGRR